jgi:outer membrane protein TolC
MSKYKIILFLFMTVTSVVAYGQDADSLNRYLQTAAENNPDVKAAFYTYEAALQKVPQMGAYEDPQLEMGFFLDPMNLVDGRQIAQFQLMQMFPWFGTRKAARTEAQHMARMTFEQFRETRDNLYLEVYAQWYVLCALQRKRANTGDNIALLKQLEQLVLRKFSSGGSLSGGTQNTGRPTAEAGNIAASPSGGMAGMGMTTGQTAQGKPSAGNAAAMSAPGNMGSMGGGSSSGMSEVLRIQLEIVELENAAESILSEITAEKARFNALLNRPAETAVAVPDTLIRIPFLLDVETVMQAVSAQNPMLGMIREETQAYKARLEMEKKMGYPMFGVGLQYMLIGKSLESVAPVVEMSRSDMETPATAAPMKSMNGKDMFMPMISVSIPLYRGKYKAAQRENRFLQQANEAKYAGTYNQLQAELHQLRHRLDDAQRKIRLYRTQSDLARATYELVIQEFATGKSDLGAVIQVQRQLLDYELKTSDAIAGYNTLVATVRKMISSTYDNEQIN